MMRYLIVLVLLPWVLFGEGVRVATGEFVEERQDIVVPGVDSLTLRRCYQISSGSQDFLAMILAKKEVPSSKVINQDEEHIYFADKDGVLCQVSAVERVTGRSLGYLKFTREADHRIVVTSSNGNSLVYKYRASPLPPRNEKAWLLEEVIYPEGHVSRYSYMEHPTERRMLVTSRVDPEGRVLLNTYYPKDSPHAGMLATQSIPAGSDSSPVLVSRYSYGEGFTEVEDAYGGVKRYYFDASKQLTSIETWLDGAIYRTDRYYFNEDQRLTSQILFDSRGQALVCTTYSYDKDGRKVEETAWGDLSGLNLQPLEIDPESGMPLENGVEHYSIYYKYDKKNLISKREDNGACIDYYYDQFNRLIEQKYGDGTSTNVLTCSYRYNDWGQLVEASYGDAVILHATTYEWSAYADKHPSSISIHHTDLKTHEKEADARIEFCYDAYGRPIEEKHFDPSKSETVGVVRVFDAQGRCLQETYDDGRVVSRRYDANGNLKEELESDSKGSNSVKVITYDFANRPVVVENGKGESTHTFYDLMGRPIAEMDVLGNRTSCTYDGLGRVVRMDYPAVLDRDSCESVPVVQAAYDPLDRVVEVMDPNGNVVKCRYNIRNQVVEISYPDGTNEWKIYALDGTLKKEVARNGMCALYFYDSWGRLLKKDVLGSDGVLISSEKMQYNALQCLEKEDHQGNITKYNYSLKGTQKGFVKQNKDGGWFKAEHTRDQLLLWSSPDTQINVTQSKRSENDLSTERVKVVNARGQFVWQETSVDKLGAITKTQFDALGRPETIRAFSQLGEELRREEIRYSLTGQKVSHCIYVGETQVFSAAWEYNAHNALMSVSEGTRRTVYRYNHLGQMVASIKPDGVAVACVYDAAGRLAEVTSSDGSIAYAYQYNTQGLIASVKDLNSGELTSRYYNDAGYLVEEVLQNKLVLKKKVDNLGRCTELTLPDGSKVIKKYQDAYLSEVERLDKEGYVQYTYKYLEFSESGAPTKARMPGDAGEMTWKYQTDGRLKEIDSKHFKQTMEWSDNGKLLWTVTGEEKQREYQYDEAGRLSDDGSAYKYDDLGHRINPGIQLTYDENGNMIKIEGPSEKRKMKYDAFNRLVEVVLDDATIVKYRYDSFGRRVSSCRNQEPSVYYLYDGQDEIGSLDEKGSFLSFRVLGFSAGAEIGASLAIEVDGKVFAPLHDHQGSVSALINIAGGGLEARYRYSAFGEVKESATGISNPWQFSSKRCDPDTGWSYFGQRYYLPALGQWLTPDPKGFCDGFNRYAYASNNPLSFSDAYGCFSISTLWNGFCSTLSRWVHESYDALSKICVAFREKYSLWNTVKPKVDNWMESNFSTVYLQLAGYYSHAHESGVYGHGELNDKVRITFLNGMGNVRNDLFEALELISSSHGDINVHYVFHPTEGWTRDLFDCTFAKIGYVTPFARHLAAQWRSLIHQMGEGGLIIHYAHSIGGTDTYSAALLLTPDERKLIRIITIGSATLVPDDHCESCVNYVSRYDSVPFIADMFSYLGGILSEKSNVVYLGNCKGYPMLDHILSDGTYRELLLMLGRKFLSLYGN